MSINKYSIRIDVESDMPLDKFSKKIDRWHKVGTSVEYYKIEKVEEFDKSDWPIAQNYE
jgi:hypothetical protein